MKTVLEGEGWSNTCHDVNIIVPLYERFKSYKCKFIGDSNEAKIRVAEYSTILFQQGQFLSRVRPTKFKANIIAKIERY